MPVPISNLLEEKPKPVCIEENATVGEAMAILLGQDFNQLPVVDAEGRLTGIISEQTILRTYFHSKAKVVLCDLAVNNCQEEAAWLREEDSLIEALDLLQYRGNYALVVVNGQKEPVGILTHYDMTSYFRQVSEALMYVENIELTLRRYIETVFPTPDARKQAVIDAFGYDRRRPHRPAKRYFLLGFGGFVKLMTDDDNWPKFQGVLEPQALFINLMDPVRDVRNILAHFRGRPSDIQFDGLKAATDWLATRPAPVPLPGECDELAGVKE